ncbi:uncharacterized protein LOC144737789 isoform X2 [Lampetra planeri]
MAVDLTTSVPAIIIIIIAVVISGVTAADDEKTKAVCEKELSHCSKGYNVCKVEGEDLLVRCPLPPSINKSNLKVADLTQIHSPSKETTVAYYSNPASDKPIDFQFKFHGFEDKYVVFVARNANTTLGGNYSCRVLSVHTTDEKTKLEVKIYKALSVSVERDVSAVEGGNVTLWCNVTRLEDGERLCGVTWTLPSTSVTVSLNDSQVSSSMQQLGPVMYEGHLDLKDGSSHVTLYNVTRVNGGYYSCVINTTGSRGTATGHLRIISPSTTVIGGEDQLKLELLHLLWLLVIIFILVLVFALYFKRKFNNKTRHDFIRSNPELQFPYDVKNEARNNETPIQTVSADGTEIPTGIPGTAVYAVLEHRGDRSTAGQEPATCIYSLAGAATADHTTSPEGSCLYSVVNVENTRRKKKKSKEKSEHEDASGIYSLVNADSG